jgi:hypothetical protein
MAIHAGLRWRDAGERGGLDGRVTVPAVNPVIADMVSVAELHWLLSRDEGLGRVGRPGESRHKPKKCPENENSPKDTHLGEGVSAGVKDLSHGPPSDPLFVGQSARAQQVAPESPDIIQLTWAISRELAYTVSTLTSIS